MDDGPVPLTFVSVSFFSSAMSLVAVSLGF